VLDPGPARAQPGRDRAGDVALADPGLADDHRARVLAHGLLDTDEDISATGGVGRRRQAAVSRYRSNPGRHRHASCATVTAYATENLTKLNIR
jgi:hypothetical protein